MVPPVKCRICGDEVDPKRVELGYDYCLKEACQERAIKRVELASVAVNKAADYISGADEVPRPPAPDPITIVGDDSTASSATSPNVPAPTPKRIPSTLARLREQEARLDAALKLAYERFERGEITAREMERERDTLVEAFNRLVRDENIRYRSMLRPRPVRGR